MSGGEHGSRKARFAARNAQSFLHACAGQSRIRRGRCSSSRGSRLCLCMSRQSRKPKVQITRFAMQATVYWTAKDRHHCMKISMAHPHLGMVRNRKTFGLRVEDAVFQKIWGEERPADEVPKMIRIRSRWRVTGIPAFAEFGHVQKWLDQVKWRAKVLKKLRNCTEQIQRRQKALCRSMVSPSCWKR